MSAIRPLSPVARASSASAERIMAVTISCRSVRPSTVSARVCSSICGVFRPDAVADCAVADGGEGQLIHQISPKSINCPAWSGSFE